MVTCVYLCLPVVWLTVSTCSVVTWGLHASVVVRVDTDVLLLGAKGELTAVQGFELVVGLQVRPAPDPTVDDMGETFPVGHL